MDSAAIALQKYTRGWLARKYASEMYQQRTFAAITLQRAWRCRSERRQPVGAPAKSFADSKWLNSIQDDNLEDSLDMDMPELVPRKSVLRGDRSPGSAMDAIQAQLAAIRAERARLQTELGPDVVPGPEDAAAGAALVLPGDGEVASQNQSYASLASNTASNARPHAAILRPGLDDQGCVVLAPADAALYFDRRYMRGDNAVVSTAARAPRLRWAPEESLAVTRLFMPGAHESDDGAAAPLSSTDVDSPSPPAVATLRHRPWVRPSRGLLRRPSVLDCLDPFIYDPAPAVVLVPRCYNEAGERVVLSFDEDTASFSVQAILPAATSHSLHNQ